MCHHPRQYMGCKQHSKRCLPLTHPDLLLLPCPHIWLLQRYSSQLISECSSASPNLYRRLAERATDLLSKLSQIYTQHWRAATNQSCGRWASNTNAHTDLSDTADTLLVRPWHTAVKTHSIHCWLLYSYLISALHSPVLTGLHLYATNGSVGLFFLNSSHPLFLGVLKQKLNSLYSRAARENSHYPSAAFKTQMHFLKRRKR